MIKSSSLLAFCLAAFAPLAGAYEYPLQFTPNPGYRGLVVAGYQFKGEEVVGNCSYYTVSGRSGRGGGGGGNIHHYHQTCRWDMYGNLLSVTAGAPPVPEPLYVKGTQAVYAVNGNGDYTGTDIKLPERGFVSTPGPHYTWLTPQTLAVINQAVYTFKATLKSDGDVPVDITALLASALHGTAAVKSTSCTGQLRVGSTCSITVIYDPTKLTSPTELAYDTLRIDLTSDAGEAHDFIQKYIIILSRKIE